MITIYSIGSIYDDEIYVGSTSRNPWQRFCEHKYSFSSNNLAVSSWKIIAKSKTRDDLRLECIEVCEDKDRMEYEKYWIKNLPHVVNKYNFETEYETYNLDYQKKNAARLCERIECTCGKFISRKNIANHKKRPSHFARESRNNLRKGLIQEVSVGCA